MNLLQYQCRFEVSSQCKHHSSGPKAIEYTGSFVLSNFTCYIDNVAARTPSTANENSVNLNYLMIVIMLFPGQ